MVLSIGERNEMGDEQWTAARMAAEEIDALLAHRLAPVVYLKEAPSIQELAAVIQKQQGWQPIETAPKDEPLWLAGPSLVDEDYNRKGVVEGYWLDDLGWMGAIWNNEQDYWESQQINPTHWMAIPDPPTEEAENGQA